MSALKLSYPRFSPPLPLLDKLRPLPNVKVKLATALEEFLNRSLFQNLLTRKNVDYIRI